MKQVKPINLSKLKINSLKQHTKEVKKYFKENGGKEMKYNFEGNIVASSQIEWNKNTKKELLQYCVGGLLYMPATNVKITEKIIKNTYPHLKSMVLCLEDSIGDTRVEEAEKCVKKVLETLYYELKNKKITINQIPLIFIRVREPGHLTKILRRCNKDVVNSILTGVIFPKFSPNNAVEYINEFNEIQKQGYHLYMMPILESKEIIYKQDRIKNLLEIDNLLKPVSEKILNIRIGATDFSGIYGVRRDIDNTIWDLKLISDCIIDILNVFVRNYVVSGPVWEAFGNDESEEWAKGLKRELKKDKLNGIIGKTCIHPSQLKIVQESLIVSKKDFEDAVGVLGMASDIIGVEKSNNRMNEVKTHYNWARKTVCLANIYGVR